MRLIDADDAIRKMENTMDMQELYLPIHFKEWVIDECPTIDAVPVVRCRDCIHQVKVFQEDKRRKGGGYYFYDCGLADGYSHVGLDDDFCSMGKRRSDEQT